ncbi:MAG: flagellin [Thermodesulfobacteriota bacterium]
MGLRINTNIEALNAHKNLSRTDSLLSKSLERLSSGLRINKAADDSSGLAIADGLRAQHTGISQAVANANDGVNIIQIADGALEESINIVNSIRTKAVQAASDGQNTNSRQAIQADINKLLEELEMIADTTQFNGVALLDGSFTNKIFQVGAYKGETIGVSIADARGSKVGAMAYAATARDPEAAVSQPFLQGGEVTAESLSDGDIYINNTKVGATAAHTIYYGAQSVSVGNTTAMAKAQAINEKVNTTGVQAKATTEAVIELDSAGSYTINGVRISGGLAADTAAEVVSFVANNGSLQKMGIRAEKVANDQVRLIAEDGRDLTIAVESGITFQGVDASAKTLTVKGTLTLSNARAMVAGSNYVKAGTINAGDLLINGVDLAAGGSITVIDYDGNRTLVNAINGNQDLQRLGIRAEVYNPGGGSRIRLISDNQAITISGSNTSTVAGLLTGTTSGTSTTGVVVTGNPVDSDATSDNYLRKLGFDGARFGSSETSGYANTGGNDTAVLTRGYLTGSRVTSSSLSDGDIYLNDTKIGATAAHNIYYSTQAVAVAATTALAKAQAINDQINASGVQAKATTEAVIKIDSAGSYTINGVRVSGGLGADTADELVSFVANNGSLQKMGIRAEKVDADEVRLIAQDGRNISIAVESGLTINGVDASANTATFTGTLSLSNARAMVAGTGQITAGTINAGDLVINGVDLAASGALTVTTNDGDRTLVNAINSNETLQALGIRAELYNPDSAGARIRLISDRETLTISGTASATVARLEGGTTEGTQSTQMKISGNPVDSDTSSDNYLVKIGLSGIRYGASEQDGVDNTGGNDRVFFGADRLSYATGDVSVNGYKIGTPSDDGLSDAFGDKSAAAWAAAINLVSGETGVEADVIKASRTGAGAVAAGTLQQRDLVINGVDIVRDNTGGSGMALLDGDADHTLMDAINEYKDETGVIASIDSDGKLVLSAVDGRNIHVQSTANGNKYVKFEADFGSNGVAQDSVYFGNIRLVADSQFTVDGAGASTSSRELSLLKMGLSGGGASTGATSDLKGDGTITAGLNYATAIAKVDVTSQEGASIAIRSADFALKRLDEIRGNLGSVQNQFTSTIANLSVTRINVQATESSVRDVDFAAESSNFSKMQVLMQAGTFAMSQANATSQSVLSLLQ